MAHDRVSERLGPVDASDAARRSPIQFAIQLPNPKDLSTWTNWARRAEAAGFHAMSVPDHLARRTAQVAPLVALSAAAAVTERIRLATTVLNNDFRHPVMLAKEAATVDLLSGGRLDLGIGAGWLADDYTSTGIARWDPAGVRVERLTESIELLRKLLTGAPVTFKGSYYEVSEFESTPRAVQQPIPLMIGAGGPKMLSLAARHADVVHFVPRLGDSPDLRATTFERQLDRFETACTVAGRRPTLGVRILAGAIRYDRTNFVETIARTRGGAHEGVADSPYLLVGSTEEVKEHILALRQKYGVSYFTVSEELAWAIAPMVSELAAEL